MDPILGICLPTYNRARLLKEGLEVLIPQATKFNVPIYISDDCSDDQTEFVVREFGKFDNYIFYRRNSVNMGLYSNVIQVLRMAKSNYVWLMGDDDQIFEGAVKKVIDTIEHRNIDYVVLNSTIFDDKMRRVTKNQAISSKRNIEYPLGSHGRLLLDLTSRSYHGFMSAMIIKRSLLDTSLLELEQDSFPFFGNSWAPMILFYKSITHSSGVFLSKPLIKNRINERKGRKVWQNLVVDHIKALDSLPKRYYKRSQLKRALNLNFYDIFYSTLLENNNWKDRHFDQYIGSSRILSFRFRLLIDILDRTPIPIKRVISYGFNRLKNP